MGFAKYIEVAKMNFSNSLVYIWDFLSSSIFVGVIIFIYINFTKKI